MSRKKWSSDKIFERLLNNKSKQTYWDNISELRSRPNKDVFRRAFSLTKSESKKEKIVGIDILAQLGLRPRLFKKETIIRYFELLNNEIDKDILMSLFYAIGHNNESLTSSQISKMVQFKNHKISEVRLGLVSALLGIEKKEAIKVLIELTKDNVSSIRNWATFGIGSQIEILNKEIKEALWERTKDKHQETKFEALVGLANRGESQIKEIIIEELEKGEYGTLIFEAIERLNDKVYLPYLEKNLESVLSDQSIFKGWKDDLKECIRNLKTK